MKWLDGNTDLMAHVLQSTGLQRAGHNWVTELVAPSILDIFVNKAVHCLPLVSRRSLLWWAWPLPHHWMEGERAQDINFQLPLMGQWYLGHSYSRPWCFTQNQHWEIPGTRAGEGKELPLGCRGVGRLWMPLKLCPVTTVWTAVFSSYLKRSRTLFPGRQRHPTPVLLSGKSHGRRSLIGCSPWGR